MTSTSVARPGVADVTSIAATRTFYQNLAAALADDVVQIELALANLADLDLDEQTLDGFQSAQADADRAMRRCRATVAVLDTLHGGVEAAVQATPGAARIDFYQEDTAQEHVMTANQPATASTEPSASASTGPVPASPSDGPATAPIPPTTAVKDPLKVSGKLVLRDGETFAGSTSTQDDEGYMVLAAAVDTTAGRTVHVGVPVHTEEKAEWKGAHAPAQETRLDPDSDPDDADDDRFFTVATNSDVTVVVEAADAAKLPDQVEEIITAATQSDREYRQLAKEYDRLYDERMRLETKRYGDTTDADLQMRLDGREDHHKKFQKWRQARMDEAVDRLGPEDRASYEQLQRRIDEAGEDRFEPDKQQQAAEVCGLSVDEYRELVELKKKHWRSRTPAESARYDELAPDRKPPLLAEQAAIVHGLTLDEYRELESLDKAGTPRPADTYRRASGRTPEQQARYEALRSSPRGATGSTPRQTEKLRDQFARYQDVHHSDKLDWAMDRQRREELTSRAGPLDAADAARLEHVIAEHDALSERLDALGGKTTAAVEVPGRTGARLVVEAVQREEEGGVDYLVDCKPANAEEDWSAGGHDTYRTTAGGLRKVAKALAAMATPWQPASPARQAFPRPPQPGVGPGDAAAPASIGGTPQSAAQQHHHYR